MGNSSSDSTGGGGNISTQTRPEEFRTHINLELMETLDVKALIDIGSAVNVVNRLVTDTIKLELQSCNDHVVTRASVGRDCICTGTCLLSFQMPGGRLFEAVQFHVIDSLMMNGCLNLGFDFFSRFRVLTFNMEAPPQRTCTIEVPVSDKKPRMTVAIGNSLFQDVSMDSGLSCCLMSKATAETTGVTITSVKPPVNVEFGYDDKLACHKSCSCDIDVKGVVHKSVTFYLVDTDSIQGDLIMGANFMMRFTRIELQYMGENDELCFSVSSAGNIIAA